MPGGAEQLAPVLLRRGEADAGSPTAASCCARRTGAGTTSRASAHRRAPPCSSAAASATRSARTTGSCSSTGQTLTLDQVHDAYRDHWTRELAAEQAKRGITWDAELDEPRAFAVGLDALAFILAELVPRIGRPVAVQRRLECALAPDLEWTIQGYLDLETLRPDGDGGDPSRRSSTTRSRTPCTPQARADHDPQAGLYVAGRWLAGDPAHEFSFAQIGKLGRRRKQMSISFVTTRRSAGQLRAMLVRIGQAASQIVAAYERFGPDQPWRFVDPAGWKCSARYCAHHRYCPGGGGLSASDPPLRPSRRHQGGVME